MSRPIDEYALIGDLHSAALVSRDGSLDWLCLPRFDSPACFAALVGGARDGYWQISPVDGAVEIKRRYRPDTLIVETEFTTGSGTADRLHAPARHGRRQRGADDGAHGGRHPRAR